MTGIVYATNRTIKCPCWYLTPGDGQRNREGTIFLDAKDREDFIARLAALAEGKAMAVYAWALLPNHFHLLHFRGGKT